LEIAGQTRFPAHTKHAVHLWYYWLLLYGIVTWVEEKKGKMPEQGGATIASFSAPVRILPLYFMMGQYSGL
jgi:hypothetical protein